MAVFDIHVVAAVLEDQAGRVLVTERPPGKLMAGSWEFPGGKAEAGETRFACLVRELEEELGIHVDSARPLLRYRHIYPDLEVDLDVWRALQWRGQPRGLEGQSIAWQRPEDLLGAGLLTADAPVVNALRMPSTVVVTSPNAEQGENAFLDALEMSLEAVPPSQGLTCPGALVCLRRPDLGAEALLELAVGAACRVEGTRACLLLHGDPAALAPLLAGLPAASRPRLASKIAGLHVPARFVSSLSLWPVPEPLLFGVSCHGSAELRSAQAASADYAFLGPVKPTPSHPGEPGLGWDKFSELIKDLPLPVYAIGGVGPDDVETAWAAGAQGVAGISAFWPK